MEKAFPYIAGLLVTFVFSGLIALIIFKVVPEESRDVVSAMTGVLGAAFLKYMSFLYGSSEGSKRKTELMLNTNKET